MSYLLDYSKWQYYAVLFLAIALMDLVSELLSMHNVFTKTGEYRIEDNSIYIKKSSGEKEIPMDMVDSIRVTNDGILSSSYNVRIQLGKSFYCLRSESVNKKSDFSNTSLYPIVWQIVNANGELKYFPPLTKTEVHIWKYEDK